MDAGTTRIRIRSMNHSVQCDVDAARWREGETRGAASSMPEKGAREGGGKGDHRLAWRKGWMHPVSHIYMYTHGSGSPVAGAAYAGAGVLKSGGGCGRVPITRR